MTKDRKSSFNSNNNNNNSNTNINNNSNNMQFEISSVSIFPRLPRFVFDTFYQRPNQDRTEKLDSFSVFNQENLPSVTQDHELFPFREELTLQLMNDGPTTAGDRKWPRDIRPKPALFPIYDPNVKIAEPLETAKPSAMTIRAEVAAPSIHSTGTEAVRSSTPSMTAEVDAPSTPSIVATPSQQLSVRLAPKLQCHICSARFLQKSHLDCHISAVHLKLRPYQCNTCSHRSARKSDLNKHIKIVHERQMRYRCKFCPLVFSQKYNLDRHIEKSHSEHYDPVPVISRSRGRTSAGTSATVAHDDNNEGNTSRKRTGTYVSPQQDKPMSTHSHSHSHSQDLESSSDTDKSKLFKISIKNILN